MVAVTQLVKEPDLVKYQADYSEDNKRTTPPEYKPFVLTPPHHKQTFTLDIDPSAIITED